MDTRIIKYTSQTTERIDKFLQKELSELSRTNIQNLISEGYIKVDGKEIKTNFKLKEGNEITIEYREPEELDVVKQDIPIDIVYEDNDLIVVNKTKGMVVHPSAGHRDGTLVNALLFHSELSSINGTIRPGIVHRIDKDTSGLLVVAKNDKGFIQSENDQENPTLMDTLNGINIKNHILRINFSYFLSAGSYSASQTIFTFRFQNNRFELIGLDNNSFMRNSGEQEEFSINFSTNKMKTTSGRNMFDEELSKPKETWENINIKKKYTLDEMSKDTLDVILDYVY